MNGRIDLSQAEAVMDFIRSKTDRASKVAMNQIEGRLSDLIKTTSIYIRDTRSSGSEY